MPMIAAPCLMHSAYLLFIAAAFARIMRAAASAITVRCWCFRRYATLMRRRAVRRCRAAMRCYRYSAAAIVTPLLHALCLLIYYAPLMRQRRCALPPMLRRWHALLIVLPRQRAMAAAYLLMRLAAAYALRAP